MPLSHVIAGNEPPINNAPIFSALFDTLATAFAAEGSQYAALKSFYTATGGDIPPPPPPGGISSFNGATNVVQIIGGDGARISNDTPPTFILATITPRSINTPGNITSSGAFTGNDTSVGTLTAGPVSCPSLNTTAGITAASITTPEASAASATITGAVTANTFAVPGALTAATLTNGSLGAPPPVAMSYSTPSSYSMAFSGWFLQWGISGPSGTVDGKPGTIRVQYGDYAVYTGDYVLVVLPVNVAGQSPFIATSVGKPQSTQFYVACTKNGNPIDGAVVSWMTIGKPLY